MHIDLSWIDIEWMQTANKYYIFSINIHQCMGSWNPAISGHFPWENFLEPQIPLGRPLCEPGN